jgi:HPr kinase/phosphorylase
VAVGRNLAVLIEAAVRNHILQLRGYNSTEEFVRRQRAEMEKDVASAPASTGTDGAR